MAITINISGSNFLVETIFLLSDFLSFVFLNLNDIEYRTSLVIHIFAFCSFSYL